MLEKEREGINPIYTPLFERHTENPSAALAGGCFLFFEATKEVDLILDVDGVADNRDIAGFIVGGAICTTANMLNGAVNREIGLSLNEVFGDIASSGAGVDGFWSGSELGFAGLGELSKEVDVFLVEWAGG